MSQKAKVLFVLTSHYKLGNTGRPTGWYLPEFAHPYFILNDNYDIVVASPAGGEAPLDPHSVEATKDDAKSQDFLQTKGALWKNTEKLVNFLGRAKEFEAIFYVGGHGPTFDLTDDPVSHKLINEFYAADKIVSAVCHGSAALVHVKLPSGAYLLEGEPVTGFSNDEEGTIQLSSVVPYSLEDELNNVSGGKYEKAKDKWGSHVVVGRNGKLITGQNPASATAVGLAINDAIQRR